MCGGARAREERCGRRKEGEREREKGSLLFANALLVVVA
jgi:hypothetical protein